MTRAVRTDLTRGQHNLWAAQLLHPAQPIYDMAFAFELGPVDPDRFEAAFQDLIASCDALRMVFVTDAEGTHQVVREPFVHPVPRVPIGEDSAVEWARSQLSAPIDVHETSFRTALLTRPDGSYVWFIVMHHVFTDGWSFLVLYDRMRALYAGTDLEPLPSFADHALTEPPPTPAAAVEHWSTFGKAHPAPLYGRSSKRLGTTNRRIELSLGMERSERLRALAMTKGIRGLTVDMGLFQLLTTLAVAWIHRVSAAEHIELGAPSLNRTTPAHRETVGVFTEVFPLGVGVVPEDTFRTLHSTVRRSTHAYLRAARSGSSNPRYLKSANVVLNYIRGTFEPFTADAPTGATWVHAGHIEPSTQARIHVHDFHGRGELELSLDLNVDAFGPHLDTVPEHLLAILDALLDDLDTPVATVPLTKPRRDVVDAAPTWTVVDAFLDGVDAHPDHHALVEGSQTWSYAELHDAACSIAAHFETDQVVGLHIGRSAHAVITLLGVLLAGASYVPLDPEWPAARVKRVADDAKVARIVTAADVDVLLALGQSTAPIRPTPDQLAYVLYTSGSTGMPKGVRIPHRALATYVRWARETYGEGLTFPLFSQLTFDLTVTSVFVPLCSRGTIRSYPRSNAKTDLAVLDVFDDDAVDIVKLTPSHVGLLSDRNLANSRVAQLILGGEEFTTALARRTLDRFGGNVQLHNEYGPTEATVGCTLHTFDPRRDTGATVPIGRPIRGATVTVCDPAGNPLPDGVMGELRIGGTGVADGYLGRPELSAERFVDGRYRSGDLGRTRPDGIIEYLGRSDDQVKIAGVRVELGEVEAVLAAHPAVSGAAVALRRRVPETTGERILCARCGLASEYPGVAFDNQGVCSQCRAFEAYEERARVYFKPMDALTERLATAKSAPEYDCMVLLSGGKDSTYMLGRLADMGLRVLAYTLDNGFISPEAMENVARVVTALGVDHMYGSTPAMNAIFVDSLQRHANVCHGCFKTIYTLSMGVARDKKIPFIVTGLSRGQFFETRLTPDLFTGMTPSSDQIDRNVLASRKAYHRIDDAVREHLDTSLFDDDRIFDEVQFVDFYRYCDVDLDELYAYLDRRLPWVRPGDTGRSTNCTINDVGIYLHKRVVGHHNYALPYSWDVRLGHKNREAALEELDDDIDPAAVQAILDIIGYPEDVESLEAQDRLVGWYVSPDELAIEALRAHLLEQLPEARVPSVFVRVDALPLTPNGKVDRRALPEPTAHRPTTTTSYYAPRSEIETTLCAIWASALGIDRVGILDDFYALGGDSILAIQIVARAQRAGLSITLSQVFEALTVENLAMVCEATTTIRERVVGPVPLTPIQHDFLAHQPEPAEFHHVIRARLPADVDRSRLQAALQQLLHQHGALRCQFRRDGARWLAQAADSVGPVEWHEAAGATTDAAWDSLSSMTRGFDLADPPLLRAAILRGDGQVELAVVAHHLVVDAVSWNVLLDDLQHVYEGGSLPAASTGLPAWVDYLSTHVADASWWAHAEDPAPLPVDEHDPTCAQREHLVRLDVQSTRRLLWDSPGWRVGVDELLLAALGVALADWMDTDTVSLALEGHGREADDPSIDLSRTVGWLTSLYPVTLDIPEEPSIDALRSLKDQLRSVPGNGLAFGVAAQSDPTLAISEDAVLFNYLGRVDPDRDGRAPFRLSRPIALHRGPRIRTVRALEVNAVVRGEQLEVTWSYGSGVDVADVADLAATHLETLEAWMEAAAAGEDTTSATDFPLSGLDSAGFEKLASILPST